MNCFKILLLLLGLVSAIGAVLPKDEWRNPVISCKLKEQEDPIRQHPLGESTASAADMEAFCQRMERRFSQSGLTTSEANRVYQSLYQSGLLKDGTYGMPGPGAPHRNAPTLKEYKKRIAIRKVGKDTFELFYSYINCGTNYEYVRVKLDGSVIEKQERIEAWSGLFPC